MLHRALSVRHDSSSRTAEAAAIPVPETDASETDLDGPMQFAIADESDEDAVMALRGRYVAAAKTL